MTMKSIFFAVAVAALVGAAIASCPNACSGHGSCGNHDRCTCYANFVGGDCSEKACPYGRSDKECSGRGTCDRGAGSCECADGYSGASCQRTSCPNGCSGKGSCDTTTGMCNCAGGYSGNDCGTRLCPKGDDPLTHEVENSGDGTASQQSEVQTVTFNAGRGLGGTATLTYNDLYGQSWTTRPFNVGGDNVYRLEVGLSGSPTCDDDSGANNGAGANCDLQFTYNGNTARLQFHADGPYSAATAMSAATLRGALLPLFGGHAAKPIVGKDRGNTIYVKRHSSTTSVKISGVIVAGARVTYDIVIPVDMSGHDDNGELGSALTVAWVGSNKPTVNTAALSLYQVGDRSAEIESALSSLPNQVIPSVTVIKVGITDTDTNSDGANGNVYAQSYAITFNNEANSGDQNMLTCNAAPCDDDGCINRGPGVSEVRYMHHDPENAGEGINFVNQGYFIMDIGSDAGSGALSAGSIKIMWDTGAGIDSAIFAVVATASEVQTALRTISGWEAVTVELWGSREDAASSSALKLLQNHQFKVTFAAGYDDLGKIPTFYTMLNTDGAYATASPTTARARLYDQRFSNSIWLGKLTGYVECKESAGATATCSLQSTDIGGTENPVTAMALNGDVFVTSNIYFGVGGTSGDGTTGDAVNPGTATGSTITLQKDTTAMAADIVATNIGISASKVGFAYLKEGKISVQTSDYFAVGSTVEVLGTTWDDEAVGTDIDAAVGNADSGTTAVYNPSSNKYRKFKVTGHVTNDFNREFAKLDSFPADDGITVGTSLEDRPDYNLKITSNNGTVHTYPSANVKITLQEVQVITLGTGQENANLGTADVGNDDKVWKLYYKGEESQNMDAASTAAQIAEEINGFSQLSGPVTVAGEGTSTSGKPRFTVTFDAKDGDVAQMTAIATAGVNAADNDNTFDSDAVTVSTRANGWSIEGPVGEGLGTMQAGGIINITAAEVCTFVEGTALSPGHFCYDNVCGPEIAALTLTDASTDAADGVLFQNAVRGIMDDNGDAILGTATVVVVEATQTATVTMPLGKSCDSLELRGTTNAITKSVAKNNNGKLFRITRSFLKTTDLAFIGDSTTMKCSAGDCHDALEKVDSVLLGGDSCAAIEAVDGPYYPVVRTAGAVTLSATTNPTTVAVAAVAITGTDNSDCTMKLARRVITLDSMPDEKGCDGTTCTSVSIAYTSPVGSCSVTETTKGTYESYECSNRGACDGKSGLCTCYEGYSGQSCQTQTVLV